MLFIIVNIVYIYVCNMYVWMNHYNHQSKDKTLTLGRMLTLHALSFFSIRSSFFLTISISILSARTEIFAGPNYTEWLQRLTVSPVSVTSTETRNSDNTILLAGRNLLAGSPLYQEFRIQKQINIKLMLSNREEILVLL